ncbi:aldehyde dehydrogenase [Paraburkholderia phytofirmans]|uniref:aldehyde dehydrogenase n=1 Tax=Paraburkholderia phytofirmans TaxID=261302 RepID=UPI0038B6C5FE
MQVRSDFFIDGCWQPPAGRDTLDVISPHTEAVIGRAPDGTPADIDAAVAAARRAFDRGPWPTLAAPARAAYLRRFAQGLRERSAELAAAVSREGGFPIATSELSHVLPAVAFVDYYADLIERSPFESGRDALHFDTLVRRLPIGVVGAIVPWNIPILGALSKLAPALAAGCTVVLKPSPETPLSSFLLAEIAQAAEFPAGVFNLVSTGIAGSMRLVAHPDVDKIAFTGSTAVGKLIARNCADTLKRCSLELGGNAAAIVLDDAPLELVAQGLLLASLIFNNGEACIAQRRILVPKALQPRFVDALHAVAQSVRIGDPEDPQTQLGPLVTKTHAERVRGYIGIGKDEGATLVSGGATVSGLSRGWYVAPTIFTNVHHRMRIASEEIFGPVVNVIAYDDEDEALRIAGDTEYGLSGSVWSADVERATALGKQLRVGSVYVNGSMALDPNVPFGGFRQSGLGRELGPEGLGEYLETQAILRPKAH